mgnify:CR=1 FL=1
MLRISAVDTADAKPQRREVLNEGTYAYVLCAVFCYVHRKLEKRGDRTDSFLV